MASRLSKNVMRWAIQIPILLAAALLSVAPATGQLLDGTWRSEGYGYAFNVRGGEWEAFEITSTTCVPGFTATRSGDAMSDREATFKTKEGRPFFLRPGGSNDHKVLHFDGSASDMRIDRLSRMPAICDHPTPDTLPDNFEVFARTWAEQYISFDLKHVDWDKVVAANRPKVTAETRPIDLFAILAGMIQPFGDAHTSINAPAIGMSFHGFRLGVERSQKDALTVTDSAYLKSPLQKFCENQVQYGHIDEATGYLRILSFSGFSAAGDFASGLAELENALDTIFSDTSMKALVIDVRINSGGSDPYGLAIASRLATREYLAYNKVARADPADRNKWTPTDPSVVKPGTRPGFRGPVVELTGPSTVSAGETFTQALMGRTPHITRIGENTQGVFSDVLGRRLPNGWRFGLPNEVFLTSEGKAFDGPGIPPDIEVPVFAASDLAAGKDPAMAKAIEVLASIKAHTPTGGATRASAGK
ncbi:MAG TPA: S41 family peptidase [Terriglobales bacterium]|nr:S41 family peptidase [Terriglobales bacterium]